MIAILLNELAGGPALPSEGKTDKMPKKKKNPHLKTPGVIYSRAASCRPSRLAGIHHSTFPEEKAGAASGDTLRVPAPRAF